MIHEAGIELAIDARELRKEFASVTAVDGVTLAIPRGEIFGLIGPDGAGKSTLIRLLTTVMLPSAGDAYLFGESVTRSKRTIEPRIGYMSQGFSLYGDLTVRENLDFFAKLRGVSRVDSDLRSARLLEFSGLTEFAGRQAQFLSGGMKQKLALAVTLISEPDLLFLDEPTTGVDPVSRREFWRIIADLHAQGITVFVATPYMDEAERCTEIAFMSAGRIILRDTPQGMKERVRGSVVEIGIADYHRAMPLLRALPFVSSVDAAGDLLRVLVDTPAEKSPADGLAAREAELRAELESAGFSVGVLRSGVTDLEMAFATLIPAAGDGAPVVA